MKKLGNSKFSKSYQLMEIIDKLAFVFGIFLTDDAHIKVFSDKKIDLSLLLIMKENKLFYEKYGYENCDGETDFFRNSKKSVKRISI